MATDRSTPVDADPAERQAIVSPTIDFVALFVLTALAALAGVAFLVP